MKYNEIESITDLKDYIQGPTFPLTQMLCILTGGIMGLLYVWIADRDGVFFLFVGILSGSYLVAEMKLKAIVKYLEILEKRQVPD